MDKQGSPIACIVEIAYTCYDWSEPAPQPPVHRLHSLGRDKSIHASLGVIIQQLVFEAINVRLHRVGASPAWKLNI
jgi:hypothetical protein